MHEVCQVLAIVHRHEEAVRDARFLHSDAEWQGNKAMGGRVLRWILWEDW